MTTVKEAVIDYLKSEGKYVDPVLTCKNTEYLYDIGKIEVKLKDDSIDIFYVEDFIFSEKRTLSGKAFGKIYEVEYDKPSVREAKDLEKPKKSPEYLEIQEVICHPLRNLSFEELMERFDAWSPQTYPHIFEDVKEWLRNDNEEPEEGTPHFLKPNDMSFSLDLLEKYVKDLKKEYNNGVYKDTNLINFAENTTLILQHLVSLMLTMELPIRNLWLDLHSNTMVNGDYMSVNCKFHGEEIMKHKEKRGFL